MVRYRKKPVVIEAVQVLAAVYNGKTWNRSPFKCDVLPQWLEDAFTNGIISVHPSDRDYALLAIKAPEGTMIAEPADWIVRGVKGESAYRIRASLAESVQHLRHPRRFPYVHAQ